MKYMTPSSLVEIDIPTTYRWSINNRWVPHKRISLGVKPDSKSCRFNCNSDPTRRSLNDGNFVLSNEPKLQFGNVFLQGGKMSLGWRKERWKLDSITSGVDDILRSTVLLSIVKPHSRALFSSIMIRVQWVVVVVVIVLVVVVDTVCDAECDLRQWSYRRQRAIQCIHPHEAKQLTQCLS